MRTADFLEKWLKLRAPYLAQTTYASYEKVVQNYLNPEFGDTELDEITPLDVELFLGALLGAGKAPSTVKRIYSVFRSAMNKAARMGLLSSNPTGYGRIDPLPKGQRDIQHYSADDLRQIFAALGGESLRWQSFVRTAVDTGARRGELVALQWRDFSADCIEIRRAAYKLTGESAKTKAPKSGRSRTVHITADTAALLEQLRREQKKAALKTGAGWSSQFYIFGELGQMLHPTTPTKWWRRFLEQNDLPRRPLHALRHTSATLLLSGGVDIKTVSSRLGHSSLEVTQIYLHLVAGADQKAAEVLSNIL